MADNPGASRPPKLAPDELAGVNDPSALLDRAWELEPRSRHACEYADDQRCDIQAEIVELRHAHVGVDYREERVRMDEQQALAPLYHEHVGVPVIAVWLGVNRRASPTAHQLKRKPQRQLATTAGLSFRVSDRIRTGDRLDHKEVQRVFQRVALLLHLRCKNVLF
jgi:hypothetical protein